MARGCAPFGHIPHPCSIAIPNHCRHFPICAPRPLNKAQEDRGSSLSRQPGGMTIVGFTITKKDFPTLKQGDCGPGQGDLGKFEGEGRKGKSIQRQKTNHLCFNFDKQQESNQGSGASHSACWGLVSGSSPGCRAARTSARPGWPVAPSSAKGRASWGSG